MDGMSLLDVLRGVMLDPAEQASYNADPHAYLEQYGYDDVDPADLSEAFGLVADTLPPDQAQAAWSAAPEPDDNTFGAVTQDFDGDAGIDAPEGDGVEPDAPDVDVPDIDVPDIDAPDIDAPDVEGAEDTGPALSFGEGDGVGDVDDPTFGDTAGTGVGEPDDTDAAVDGLTSVTGGDDADSAFDEGFDQGGFDSGFDDDLSDGLGESTDHGDSADDGLDDGLDDADPDDLDIGSF